MIHPRLRIISGDAFGIYAGPGLVVLLLSKARRASARKIIKIRLVSLVAVFLLRDFKTERPRLDQSSIWLFVRSKGPINASGFACHVISPLLCAEHHREIAPGRARSRGSDSKLRRHRHSSFSARKTSIGIDASLAATAERMRNLTPAPPPFSAGGKGRHG